MSARKAKGEKGELVVAGKTFKYKQGDESELQAYMDARRHLRDLHVKAVARVGAVTVTPAPATLSRKDN